MRHLYSLILVVVALAGCAVAAQAGDIFLGNLQVEQEFTLGVPESPAATLFDVVEYSNITNFTGYALRQGPSANQAGNQITLLLADDITPLGVYAGKDVSAITFSVANLNSVAVSARPRIRFWFANGAGGAPGTYYNVPASVGFSFNPITFNPGSVVLLTATVGANQFKMPGSTFWAGVTFDNNTGGTGATAAQMDNLGQGIFDPPDVGSSADVFFLTQSAGSFFPTNNPAGALYDVSPDITSNFGWEFTISTPVPTVTTTLGQVKALYR
jgi:hypothetical protein